MGLFSFLTGKKDDDGAVTTETAPEQRPSMPGPPVSTPPPAAAPAGAPAGDWQSSFTPPEAWKTEALTAPPPEASGEKPNLGPVDAAQTAALQGKVIEAVKTVYDPEIPVDIYELGLIYEILADANRNVLVKMTLTSPACPSAQQIPSEVRYKVKAIPEVTDAWVEIVWEPPWSKERMSETAKLSLGFF
jgi:FeS assembly SUF system protein